MMVAVYMHAIMKGDPFVARGSSYEVPAVYLALTILLIAAGPGRLSLDRVLFGRRP